jgi:hypothetical protein
MGVFLEIGFWVLFYYYFIFIFILGVGIELKKKNLLGCRVQSVVQAGSWGKYHRIIIIYYLSHYDNCK